MKVQGIIDILEKRVPRHLAESWDNVGLMVGRRNMDVTGVLTVLDVTEAAIEEAIAKKCNFIISHHPLIFKGMKQVTSDSTLGRMVQTLIKHDMAVYSAHTNLDVAEGGLNDLAAQQLGLTEVTGLETVSSEGLCKIACFVPVTHTEAVLKAMGDAGAGHIGNYSHCGFYSEGTGTFLPLDGATPYIGTVGEIEQVKETRVETIVLEALLSSVVRAMKEAHPYEEVAYDVYSLKEPAIVNTIGRQGVLKQPVSLKEFMTLTEQAFPQGHVRYGGARVEKVKKIALCTGSGAEFIKVAAKNGADAYVTGDVKYHDMQLAKELGIVVADVGHFGTEIGAAKLLAQMVIDGLENATKAISNDAEQSSSSGATEIPVIIGESPEDFFFYNE